MTAAPDMALARYIQHTLLQLGVTADAMSKHCLQAAEYGFDAAMVPGVWVNLARGSWPAQGSRSFPPLTSLSVA